MKLKELCAGIVINLLFLEVLDFLVLTKMSQLVKVSKLTRLKSVILTLIWTVPKGYFFNIMQTDLIFRVR